MQTVPCVQNGAQSGQASSIDADDDVMAGGLGMFEDEEGKDESWAAPQSTQKPKPKKLTGPWGDYGTPAAGSATHKAGKKRPGNSSASCCVKHILWLAMGDSASTVQHTVSSHTVTMSYCLV